MTESLARLLQDMFAREERCIASDEPCGSNECAACIYRGCVKP